MKLSAYRDFEDFLMFKFHATDGATCLDDQMPDAFDAWVQDLECDQWIKYGDEYAKEGK